MKVKSLFPRIAVVILAGGRSSRMGRDKASLPDSCPDGRRTLLDRAWSTGEEVLVELGEDKSSLFVSGISPNRRYIADVIKERGPLGGIHGALKYFIKGEGGGKVTDALFIPVDMPEISPSTLLTLIRGKNGNFDAAYFQGHELPLLVSVKEEICRLIEERLMSGKRGASLSIFNLLKSLLAFEVSPSSVEKSEFFNMNTPNEYAVWSEGL